MRRVGAPGRSLRARRALLAGMVAGVATLPGCGDRSTATPPGVTVVAQGHQDVVLTTEGDAEPLWIYSPATVGLCLDAPASLDTSQWRAVLEIDGRPLHAEPQSPTAVMATTLCFQAKMDAAAPPATAQLGARVHDLFDGSTFRIPPRRIHFAAQASHYQDLRTEMGALAARAGGEGLAAVLPAFGNLAGRARQAGYPELAVQIDLIAVYFLRQAGDHGAARRILEALPSWLDRPAAGLWAAQAALEKAALEIAQGERLDDAWRQLQAADEGLRRRAHGSRLVAVRRQAQILGTVGAVREGRERLAAALDDCQRSPCHARLLPDAQITLAWLTLIDPMAGPEDYARAEESLQSALADDPANPGPREQANKWINLAYLRLRNGGDTAAPLGRARQTLAQAEAGARTDQLRSWADLLEAEVALEDGEPRRALTLCLDLAERQGPARAAAWAWGCAGRALRRLGDRRAAADALDQALLLHATAADSLLGQAIAPGPSRQAEDYYQAARLAVERGDAGRAWQLLERLDQQGVARGERQACPPENDAAPGEQRALLADLRALDGPASGALRQRREGMRRTLGERLQELWRRQAACGGAPVADPELRFRAIALEDEILLLGRGADGEARLHRRTPLGRPRLVEILAEIRDSLDPPSDEDAAWRRLAAPLAAALIPDSSEALQPTTAFALYGPLQEVPLAALPIAEEEGGGWLGERTTPVLRPARAAAPAIPRADARPLFVVDPQRDLGGRTQATLYQRLFPEGRILFGEQARRQTFESAVAEASWLHVDAHGRFDPAFPELSRLELADQPITLIELAELPGGLAFANLSGCQTGRWPVTADSGQFGLGGLLVRQGVGWAVASRARIGNAEARRLNEALYGAMADGDSLPTAYGKAMARLRADSPAAAWAAFMLLAGPQPATQGGQGLPDRTPISNRGQDRPEFPTGDTASDGTEARKP